MSMTEQAVANIEPHRRASRVEAFMAKVMTDEDRRQIASALPSHIRMERFERNLSNALMNEPRLLECNPREVFREVAKIAAIGLLIDAQLGEAYLIVTSKGPQARIGYRGLMKLARQSGDVSVIYAHAVHEFDEIECTLGDDKRLTHKPKLFGERGIEVGYYAVVKYKDGTTDFEPMTLDEINKIRDKSDGYRAFKANKIKDTPWASSYEEMAKKTCIRRLMKRVPQSPDMADALSLEDRAEYAEIDFAREALPVVPIARTLAGRLDALAGGADPETGEIIESEEADVRGAASADQPSPATETGAAAPEATVDAAGDKAAGGDPAAEPDQSADQSEDDKLLDAARTKAMEGRTVFDRFYGRLRPEQKDSLKSHMTSLMKAAAEA